MPAPVNPNRGNLDQTQILQRAFDESTDKLRVDSSVSITSITGDVAVEIDAADGDNIAISDGVNQATITPVGPKNGLDVNVISPISVVIGGVESPTITNIVIPLANTELSFSIPVTTKKCSLKLRGTGKLQYSFTSGQSNTNFMTIYPGSEENFSEFDLTSGLDIYFQSNKNNEVLEILAWN